MVVLLPHPLIVGLYSGQLYGTFFFFYCHLHKWTRGLTPMHSLLRCHSCTVITIRPFFVIPPSPGQPSPCDRLVLRTCFTWLTSFNQWLPMRGSRSESRYCWELNNAQWLAVLGLYWWNLSHEQFKRRDIFRGHTSVHASCCRNSNQFEFTNVSGAKFCTIDKVFTLFTRRDFSLGYVTSTCLWDLMLPES